MPQLRALPGVRSVQAKIGILPTTDFGAIFRLPQNFNGIIVPNTTENRLVG